MAEPAVPHGSVCSRSETNNTVSFRSRAEQRLKEEFGSQSVHQPDCFLLQSATVIDNKTSKDMHLNGKTSAPSRDLSKVKAPLQKGKNFQARESLLDQLLEVNHIQTIQHMFVALLILFVVSTLIVDYIDQGRLVLDFELLSFAFGKLQWVLTTWLAMFVGTLFVPYYLLSYWTRNYQTAIHHQLNNTGAKPLLLAPLGITLLYAVPYLAFQLIGLGMFPLYFVVKFDLPPASRFIVIIEQIRFMMKTHSFVRENIPKCMYIEDSQVVIPSLSQYLYFLFCPTLIYRDTYPRTPKIRWTYVGIKFSQVLGCLFYTYYVFTRLCIPMYKNIYNEPFTIKVLVLNIFHSILPGILIFFLAFFSFLHCWLNMFAEMLRFADRMFYEDWWNCTSFAQYFRKWNVVVHDWLFYYVYRDFLGVFPRRFRVAATLSVFLLSAVIHEYILTVCFGFFYPVLFFLFICFGMVLKFLLDGENKGPVYNIMMWAKLFLGQGVLLSLYSQEWYAQIHCPPTQGVLWDIVVPRSWSCYQWG
uniref:O-acyltransferase n=2 Tax=Eptatretus burgeri TaxID=7764 RepID=A0A8C4WYI3_EPTBU